MKSERKKCPDCNFYCDNDKDFCFVLQSESVILKYINDISLLGDWYDDPNPHFNNRKPIDIPGEELLALVKKFFS